MGKYPVRNTTELTRDHTLDGYKFDMPNKKKHLALFSMNWPTLWRCDDCGSDIKLQNIMGTMHVHCNCQVAQVMRTAYINAKESGHPDFRTFRTRKKYPKVRVNRGIVGQGF